MLVHGFTTAWQVFFTGAGNAVLVQHQLEHDDPTNGVQKEEWTLLTDSCMHKIWNL
jgi:hypothetical protein